jgi:ATP-dependent DNA helicase RecG
MTAIEEALVNAMYHRGYDQREPVEVRINPDGIDIVSYPGPDPSIRMESLNSGKIMARRYRNRRIGEFFKELELTEGRCTGIPKMRAAMERNGSPELSFSTDEARTHFVVELPVHPELVGLRVHDEAHDEAHDGVHDDVSQSELRVLEFVAENAKSKAEIAQELGLSARGRAIHRLLEALLSKTLLEMTIPDKPNSRNQKYKITPLGNSKRQKR